MSPTQTLHESDCDQLFEDWSESVTWRRVEQDYSARSQQISESYADTPLMVIVHPKPGKQVSRTAGQLQKQELTVLVRSSDLPEGTINQSDRLLFQDQEYRLVETIRSADGMITSCEFHRLKS